MISKFFLFLFIFFIGGCSFKQEPNLWQFKSSEAFSRYAENFYEDKDLLAKSDLKSAVNYAKQGSSIELLGKIYLSSCALNISVGLDENCKEYEKISKLLNSKQNDSYFNMISNNLKADDIRYLPLKYQTFAENILNEDYLKAFEDIKNTEDIKSKFIGASLIKDRLSKEQIDHLIQTASFYGYKKLSLFWLNEAYLKQKDKNILRKIEVLK